MVVLDHVRRVVGNIDDAIVIVVALLHPWRAHSDYFERNPVNADGLADSRHSGKKLVAGLRRNHRIKPVLHVVLVVEKSSFGNVEIPDCLD